MRLSRRPYFFAILCLVALLMIPATPSDFWGVNYFCSGLAAFWAVALGLEEILAQRQSRRREER